MSRKEGNQSHTFEQAQPAVQEREGFTIEYISKETRLFLEKLHSILCDRKSELCISDVLYLEIVALKKYRDCSTREYLQYFLYYLLNQLRDNTENGWAHVQNERVVLFDLITNHLHSQFVEVERAKTRAKDTMKEMLRPAMRVIDDESE